VVVRVADRALAIPIEHAIETMRPLPILPSDARASASERGRARIRGALCPVVDLARRLGLVDPAPARRFLVVRGAHGPIALQVADVVDVGPLGEGALLEAPANDDGLDRVWADARWRAPSESDHGGSDLHGAPGAVEPHAVP
jgi:chemotaxis signal transduction protein